MPDNNQSRILSPRKRLHGQMDSLENIIGPGVGDGVGCYVIEAGANYRYHAQCDIEADGYFVVKPNGTASGKWLREAGSLAAAAIVTRAPMLLVQFSWETGSRESAALRYLGQPRQALVVVASAEGATVTWSRGDRRDIVLRGPVNVIDLELGDLLIPEINVSTMMVTCL
jgi:hypothetical protein